MHITLALPASYCEPAFRLTATNSAMVPHNMGYRLFWQDQFSISKAWSRERDYYYMYPQTVRACWYQYVLTADTVHMYMCVNLVSLLTLGTSGLIITGAL